MSTPTPLQSFMGGLGLSLPVYTLLVSNEATLGVSGFIRRAVRGDVEAACAVAGFVLGGAVVGVLDGARPQFSTVSFASITLSGLLVGIGSELANGCTSGHMICGVSRFSLRSIVATATFVLTGVATTYALYRNSLQPTLNADWSLKDNTPLLLTLQLTPLAIPAIINSHFFHPPKFIARCLVNLSTAFSFALALSYSNLVIPGKVSTFFILPFNEAFDPSLIYLAIGALPLTAFLYQKARVRDNLIASLDQKVDTRLVLGAATFGVGWALTGICPGAGLVNLGKSLPTGSDLSRLVAFLTCMSIGSLVAK